MNLFKKTVFAVPKMDCPSEEQMVRLALERSEQVKALEFNLNQRSLSVIHDGSAEKILSKLLPLNFGASIVETSDVDLELDPDQKDSKEDPKEKRVLKILLAINGFMFLSEITLGLIAQSTGLIADSLDMLADAGVYGISLYAVGRGLKAKQRAARLSGYAQMILALGVLFEVIRRFIYGSEPEGAFMIGVSMVALLANITCLWLISHHREGGVHMKASWIFSANDVIANFGVILAGVLVYFFNSAMPDLIIGTLISIVVFRGAVSILKISK